MNSSMLARLRGKTALWAMCLLPVLVFYALLWREMRPVPMFDDYHAVLRFAVDQHHQHGPAAKLIHLISAQHDEYKLLVLQSMIAVDLALTGHVHFGWLIWSGNLLVLGVAALLWQHGPARHETGSRRLLFFVPVLFLLFQLNYVENLDWAMCGLQTMPAIFFSLAAFHFVLRPGGRNVILACGSLALGSLSSANGFFAAPVGLLWLIVQRRFRTSAVWVLTTLCTVLVYRFRYLSFAPEQTASSVTIGQKLLFLLSFVGGAVEDMHHRPLPHAAVLLGSLIVFALAVAAVRRASAANPFVTSLALWSLLSAAVVTQVRSAQGLNLSLTGRYKIYSDLLLICCYLYGASWLANRPVPKYSQVLQIILIVVAALFALGGDLAGDRFLAHRQERVALGFEQYLANPAHASPEISLGGEPFAGLDPEAARVVLNEAQALGIYRLPALTARR